jgi:molecular chaperone GrpE
MNTEPENKEAASTTETVSAPTVEELENKVASLEDALLRAKAETQNVRRRAAAERADAVLYGNAELVRALLTVHDDLERALSALPEQEKASPLAAGVRLALENFVKLLRDHGVEPIDAEGKPFDPQRHHALMRQYSNDLSEGTVLSQVARGFVLRDRVVRPAMVIVSRGPESTEAPGADAEPEGK